jgi:hypothetical protein
MNPQEETGLAVPEKTQVFKKFTGEHAHEVGLPSPEALNYMMSVAKLITSTALIGNDMGLTSNQKGELLQAGFKPNDIYEKNQETIKANAFAKMIVGHEFNPPIPPMAAQNEIDIVKGKIFVRYPQLIAQMEARGFKFKTIERSHERAAWEVSRPGKAEPEVFEFTIEDARRAGLIKRSRDGEALQYELRPRVMLWARLVSETYRATGGRGGVYTPEEKREILSHDEDYAPENRTPEPEEDPFTVEAKGKAEPAPAMKAPEPEERPRGRRAAPKEPEPVKQEPTQPEAAQGFKADESDLPENMQTEPPKPTGPTQQDRLRLVTDKIEYEAKRPREACKKELEAYLRAFIPGRLPALPNDKYIVPIRILESLIREGDACREIAKDGHSMGVRGYAGYSALVRFAEKLPESCRKPCVELAVERYSADGGGDMVAFLTNVVKIDGLPEFDILAFLWAFKITKSAIKLKDLADKSAVPMHRIVEDWGLDLESATEQQILTKLAAGVIVDSEEPQGGLFKGGE